MRENKNIGMLLSLGSSFTQLLKYILMIDDILSRYMLMRQVTYLICYTVVECMTLMYQCDGKLKEVVHDICTFQKEHKISDLEDESVLRVLMLLNDVCDVLQLVRQEGYTALDNAFYCSEEETDIVDVMRDYIITSYVNQLEGYKPDTDIDSDYVYDFK